MWRQGITQFFFLLVTPTQISSCIFFRLHWKKHPKRQQSLQNMYLESRANTSGNTEKASVQGHFTQMDLALESPATASSSHLYVNTCVHTHTHTHASVEDKWRGSIPLQGTVESPVDAFQFGHFGLADFAQWRQLWSIRKGETASIHFYSDFIKRPNGSFSNSWGDYWIAFHLIVIC